MRTVVLVLIYLTYLVMLGLEHFFPGRPQPKVRGWLMKGLLFAGLSGVINMLLPMWIAGVTENAPNLRLAWLGTAGGAIVGFLGRDIVAYSLHRTLHNVDFLWRWTHQMHHSAERVDIAGSAYFHPFDTMLQVTATTLATAALGISPDSAAVAGFLSFFFGLFQHLNVRTPRWIGYIVQRPEQHALHHARGAHKYNYGTFMLWDILLGTFRNPRDFVETAGYWDGASGRTLDMLLGRDVSTPPALAGASPVASAPHAS